MTLDELPDDQKELVKSYHNKYVILNHEKQCVIQCLCEVTGYGIILNEVVKMSRHFILLRNFLKLLETVN